MKKDKRGLRLMKGKRITRLKSIRRSIVCGQRHCIQILICFPGTNHKRSYIHQTSLSYICKVMKTWIRIILLKASPTLPRRIHKVHISMMVMAQQKNGIISFRKTYRCWFSRNKKSKSKLKD